MSHKVKAPPITEAVLQERKTYHYKNRDNLRQALLDERKNENAQNKQIVEKQRILAAIRYCLTHANVHNDKPMIQTTICGWLLFYPDGNTASKELFKEQASNEKEIEILKTQMKMCRERQSEIENALTAYPTWNKRVETNNWEGIVKKRGI